MKTILIARSALALAAAAAAGCTPVLMSEPLAPVTATELRQELTGTWENEDGKPMHVSFTKAGEGKTASVEWDGERFRLGHGELSAVARDDRRFFSYRGGEEGKMSDEYLFFEYAVLEDGNTVLIWMPIAERFEQAIGNNELEGTVESKDNDKSIKVASGPAAVLDFMIRNPGCVDTRHPVIYRRLGSAESPEQPAGEERQPEAPEAGEENTRE